MSNRSSYHHHDLRRALVEAVLGALDTGEAERLSMRELAARVGVSHTAAYAHFADKRALLTEAARAGFEELRESASRAAGRAAEPRERLITCGLAYLTFARKRPGLYRLMFGDAGEVDAKRARLDSPPLSAYAVVRDAVAGLPLAGRPRPAARVDEDTATAWALVHGIASLEASAAFTGVLTSPTAIRRFERASLATLARGLERDHAAGARKESVAKPGSPVEDRN